MSYCVQIDDQSNERICTSDASTKRMYERIGLRVVQPPTTELDAVAACRPGHDASDCPSGHTCQQRFAHASIPNALPTRCVPKR